MAAMRSQLIDQTDLAGRLHRTYGEGFDPADAADIRAGLVATLDRELPHHTAEQVARAFDGAVGQVRVRLDWNRFLCVLLGLLPGWWTKLANQPGVDASTMLLL